MTLSKIPSYEDLIDAQIVSVTGADGVQSTFVFDQQTRSMYVKDAQAAMNDQYCAFLHPDQCRDLIDLTARDEWGMAYRCWRRNKRPGSDAPREILRYYREDLHYAVFEQTFEVGTVAGVRIFTSSSMRRVE